MTLCKKPTYREQDKSQASGRKTREMKEIRKEGAGAELRGTSVAPSQDQVFGIGSVYTPGGEARREPVTPAGPRQAEQEQGGFLRRTREQV